MKENGITIDTDWDHIGEYSKTHSQASVRRGGISTALGLESDLLNQYNIKCKHFVGIDIYNNK